MSGQRVLRVGDPVEVLVGDVWLGGGRRVTGVSVRFGVVSYSKPSGGSGVVSGAGVRLDRSAGSGQLF